ncbi:NUDIX domain-containing protein [Glycomyces sp. A-F 0318]|uniref:NUDIX domain-containing protein n=1 Tax=Glycomyces amatae TaxID=2881355 RepID=UPI001E501BB0|nr:NUDIX domain-containing protein [Glycomyces amatae]MCD0446267.1 NUDIX domain-containing protein [Glycomyces amatae]
MDTTRRTARVFLFDDQGRLVLIKRTRPGEDPYWVLPGGGIDPGETPEAAVRREAFEELGAHIASIDLVVTAHFPSQAMVLFTAKLVSMDIGARTGSEFTQPGRGRYDIELVPPDTLPHINLQPVEAHTFVLENPGVFSRR